MDKDVAFRIVVSIGVIANIIVWGYVLFKLYKKP